MIELLQVKSWALETSFFERVAPVVMQSIAAGKSIPTHILTNQEQKLQLEQEKISAAVKIDYSDYFEGPVYETESGTRIARISMIGTLTKYGGLSAYGSKSLAGMISRADAAPDVDGIILIVDGPGGQVAGTTELGLAISQAKKPTVAFVDGMAASAHYWVASQADQIVLNTDDYTEVGSIGVLCILINEQEWLAKRGVKVEIMRAEQSTDKARLNSMEETPEEVRAQLQNQLNQMADDFINTVKKGRGDRLNIANDEIFTGKMYGIDEALQYGMADYRGNLLGAIELTANLSKVQSQNKRI